MLVQSAEAPPRVGTAVRAPRRDKVEGLFSDVWAGGGEPQGLARIDHFAILLQIVNLTRTKESKKTTRPRWAFIELKKTNLKNKLYVPQTS